MAQLFIISGWQKLTGFSGTEGYLASMGIPMVGLVTPLVILIELGGGLAATTEMIDQSGLNR